MWAFQGVTFLRHPQTPAVRAKDVAELNEEKNEINT